MSICRGCLVKDADVFHSLFSKRELFSVKEMFESLTGLTVSPEDNLPRYLCQECCEAILHFFKLRLKMLESHAYLQSTVMLTVIKKEQHEKSVKEEDSSSAWAAEEFKHQNDVCSDDEFYEEYNVPSPAEKLQTITERIVIERLEKDDTTTMLLGSSNVEVINESPEEDDFDAYEEGYRSEYLSTDAAVESEQDAKYAVLKAEAAAESRVYCCACSALRFNSQEELKQHSQEVHAMNRDFNGLRPYECGTCYKRFIHSHLLERHQTIQYRERKYACHQPGCSARFLGRSALLNHTKTKHLRVRSHVCDVCEKAFHTSSTLQCHRKIHTEKQYQCETCQKMFLRKGDLISHQTTHLDVRLFPCDQCDKCFKSRAHLQNHRFVHSSERRLKCDLCDASFTTYNDRRVHVLGHSNIHPYKCSYCDKVFKRNFKLQGHIRKVHTGERPFACSQCPQTFFVNWERTRHLRKDHNMPCTDNSAVVIEELKEV